MKHYVYTTKEAANMLYLKPYQLRSIARNLGVGLQFNGKARGSPYRFTHSDIYKLEEILREKQK